MDIVRLDIMKCPDSQHPWLDSSRLGFESKTDDLGLIAQFTCERNVDVLPHIDCLPHENYLFDMDDNNLQSI